MEAKLQQEKLNEELQIKRIQLQAKLDTERMVEGIRSSFAQITSIVKSLISRPKQLLIILGVILFVILFYYFVREFAALIRTMLQRRLGRPVLVRETSYHWSILPQFFADSLDFSNWSDIAQSARELQQSFLDIILSHDDKQRILDLALATRNTRRSQAPYRHVLLHGPPGTGKTLIARRLATCSQMDYAILSGGDVAPLGEDAVNQLHDLFKWANRSQKGLLVFIDEAEAFLSSRNGTDMNNQGVGSFYQGSSTNHLRNALNALLYQTGTPSRKFMLILATNRPQDLDAAVLDRMDVSLQIGLPSAEQRSGLIKLYMNVHVLKTVHQNQKRFDIYHMLFQKFRNQYYVDPDCESDVAMEQIINLTEGFSGREISKLFVSIQYALLLSPERRLTFDLLLNTVKNKVSEHHIKSSGFVVRQAPEQGDNGDMRIHRNDEDSKQSEYLSGSGKTDRRNSNQMKPHRLSANQNLSTTSTPRNRMTRSQASESNFE
jgi:ATPase family AAA domain-containing protein 3A/B